jgi:hypothetical protein
MSKTKHVVSREAATAYHEAGHAVACYFMHVKVRSATVISDKDQGSLGHVRHENMFRGLNPEVDLSGRVRLQIEREIIISVAGAAAQRRFSKRSWRQYHGSSDFRSASDLALRIGGDGAGATAFLHWLQLCADRLVETRWRNIECVARALMKRKTMTGEEIVDVIEGEQGHQLRDTVNRLKAAEVKQRQQMTNQLTPILNPTLAKIEQLMGLKSQDQKLRSRLISSVGRERMAAAIRHAFLDRN